MSQQETKIKLQGLEWVKLLAVVLGAVLPGVWYMAGLSKDVENNQKSILKNQEGISKIAEANNEIARSVSSIATELKFMRPTKLLTEINDIRSEAVAFERKWENWRKVVDSRLKDLESQ